MSSIGEQYAQSPCEIKTLTNDLLTTAVVRSVTSDCIEICNKADVLPVIHCDTLVKINVYNTTQGFKVLVGRVFLSTPEFMKIMEVQSIADFERRNFFRIKANLMAKAYIIEDDIPPDGALELFHINVIDLSLSGCLIKTKKKLKIGQRLVINLNLNTASNIAFCSEVQREQSISPSVNGYGCAFLDSSSRQSDLLCTYIFDKQREQIKGMREAQSGY